MSKFKSIIVLMLLVNLLTSSSLYAKELVVDFIGMKIPFQVKGTNYVKFDSTLNNEAIASFVEALDNSGINNLVDQLKSQQEALKLNDWLFYQLIRHTAEAISPKAVNYYQYTLYKWYFLAKSGYDASISFSKQQLLLYIKTDENIYGIPFYMREDKQFVCLNYHDYNKVDTLNDFIQETKVRITEGVKAFSYKITEMPEFSPTNYVMKDIDFNYKKKDYLFHIKLNPEVKTLFVNYPVADFETYFNIPLSKETYSSLIPELKNYTKSMNQKEAIDYLMRFTRYSFLYQNDQQNFGKEKRLSPEQTLIYDYSDCDDRAGLFFYLVKEIYNLPMIVMLYPTHVTIAVEFDKQVGQAVIYKGKSYSVCDPTPQAKDLKIGDLSDRMKSSSYEVVYEYNPRK